MNILGMGPMEIVLIVVLALIVFGPAKLPEIMGQIGKAIADFRRATSELSNEFNRTIQAELAETRSVVEETKSAVTGVHTSINSAISGTTPAPSLTTPASAAVAASAANGVNTAPPTTPNGTNGTTTPAEEKPPLADTTQWSWETAAPSTAAPAPSPVLESVGEAPQPGVATTAAAAVVEPPAVTPTRPASPPAAQPAPRLTRTRRSSGRDDILPPY